MGLFRTAISGAVWTTISTIVRSIVQLLQVSILTRFLEKSDFGIVAIASLFIGFTSIFLDMGISIGILHKQNMSKSEYSSLFWLNIFSGIFLTVILIFVAPFISQSYSEPELTIILQLLCVTIFFSSLGNQHRTVQQRKYRFGTIAAIEISSSVLTIMVAIILAVKGFGIYSLVFSTLFNSFFSNILFLCVGLMQDENIRFHFSFYETVPYLKIGIFSTGTQVLDYFSREIDIILISATLGKEVLGVYSLCKKLITALYSAITPIYSKVLTPLLSSLQNDRERIKEAFYNAIEVVCLINYPIFISVALSSFSIIHVFYGDQYLEGNIVLSILAIHYGYLSKGNPDICLQVAYGRTDVGFYWTIFRILIYSIATFVGAQFSIEWMAFSLFVAAQVSTPIGWYFNIYILIRDRFWDYYRMSMRPFVLALLIAIPFYFKLDHLVSVPISAFWIASYLLIYGILSYNLYKNSYSVRKVRSFIQMRFF